MATAQQPTKFALALLLLIAVQNTAAYYGQRDCKSGSKYLDSTGTRECFALVDVSSGPYTRDQAHQKCQNSFSDGNLVYVESKVLFIRNIRV